MADQLVIRVEVLRLDPEGKLDEQAIMGYVTDYTCTDLDAMTSLCADLHLTANAAIEEEFNPDTIHPYLPF